MAFSNYEIGNSNIKSVFILFFIFLFNFQFIFSQGLNVQRVNSHHHTSLSNPLFSDTVFQAWIATYDFVGGQDWGVDLVTDLEGNVYVTGASVNERYNTDYVTIKYNRLGETQWIRRYDGGNDDEPEMMVIDGAANIYITGFSTISGSGKDYCTIKYNSEGDERWVVRYTGPGNAEDYAKGIAVDNSGYVYVTGNSWGGQSYYDDVATIKYNSDGVEQWVRRYDAAQKGDGGKCIVIDHSGNILVSGGSSIVSGRGDLFTIKYNPNGDTIWTRRYVGVILPYVNPTFAYDIAVDYSDNVYIVGQTPDSIISNGPDFITVKYDSSGIFQWVRLYNGDVDDYDEARKVAVDYEGNIIVSGYSVGVQDVPDFTTIKYNALGDILWIRRSPGYFHDMALDSDGNIYLTGSQWSSSSYSDFKTIKYNSSGTKLWETFYDYLQDGDDALAIKVDSYKNVYVTGTLGVPGGYPTCDFGTIKYGQSATPVELLTFNGISENGNVVIKWQTATETNNKGFEIERTTDLDSKIIGFVKGKGTTTEITNYSFQDKDIRHGMIKYRLKQIDFNGIYEYSQTIEINVSAPYEYSLYQNFPNPFNSITTIKFSIPKQEELKLSVFNILGQELETIVNGKLEAGLHKYEYNSASLSSGIYFYKLVSRNFSQTRKMLLLK